MDSKKIKYQKNIMSALKHAEKLSMMLSRILLYNIVLNHGHKGEKTGYIWFKDNSEIEIFENIRKLKKMSEDANKIEKSLKVLSDDIKAGAKK